MTTGELLDKSQFEVDKCIICCVDTTERLSTVGEVGLVSISECSIVRARDDLLDYLHTNPSKIVVHSSCRKSFTCSKAISKLKRERELKLQSVVGRTLRSSVEPFVWKHLCFLCGQAIGDAADKRCVSTLTLGKTVMETCRMRNDNWGIEVLGRLQSCNDLVAEEAIYHKNCLTRFKKGLSVGTGENATGRPENKTAMEVFDKLCDRLESSCEKELYTLDDMCEIMSKMKPCETELDGDAVYSKKHVKNLLIDRYGEHIFFAEIRGRKNVICFREMCSYIVSEKWYNSRQSNYEDEHARIVVSAAKLIACQIRDMTCDMNHYPSFSDLAESDATIPPLLKLFMQSLIKSELQQTSLAQCIMQTARPRGLLMPIPVLLAVELDHLYGSKFLLQHLSRLGFCSSYDEVTRFKKSVVLSPNSHDLAQNAEPNDTFTQFVADNVDHNICTVDGLGTFHGMGIISASVSNSGNFGKSVLKIPRISGHVKVTEVCKGSKIKIVPYDSGRQSGLTQVELQSCQSLLKSCDQTSFNQLSMLWHIAPLLSLTDVTRSNWCGYMQTVTVGDEQTAAEIQMLPIIDLSPTDESCVYSTLLFVIEQSKKLSIVTPCITFDQPLYIKAVSISLSHRLDVVCRLGGFHLLMNFMGAIGHIMKGSGLEDVLSQIYGTNTVDHVLNGKAYARAIRGHIIVHDALTQLLLAQIHSHDTNSDSYMTCQLESLQSLGKAYSDLWSGKSTMKDWDTPLCEQLQSIIDNLNALKKSLSENSRTAKLWLLYMSYVDVCKLFIYAERTCNWHLHLNAVHQMLNLIAAAGHWNYARCARLYLQQMQDLPNTHPYLYAQFNEGKHAIRRSNRFWAGLSTDLVIEQTMMRSVKGRGGLTRGRGMHETVRSIWVNTLSVCASVHLAMATLTGLDSRQTDHSEVASARMQRDKVDLHKVLTFLQSNNPFLFSGTHLVSLYSGVVASDEQSVNCDSAEEVGKQIHEKWNGMKLADITGKKQDQVKTFAQLVNGCKIDKEHINIDVNRLFHRLLVIAERSNDVSSYFDYELTQFPTSIFSNGFMRKPNKPSLTRAFMIGMTSDSLPDHTVYVVDGGCLLYRLKWQIGVTLDEIMRQYVSYVQTKFTTNAVVVFDNYDAGPTTKDHEHKRRNGKKSVIAPVVLTEPNTKVLFQQDAFLGNSVNKQSIVMLLMQYLSAAHIQTEQAKSDADTDIVATALKLAASPSSNVAVFAEDTDILAMLLHHRHDSMGKVYMISYGKKKQKSADKVIDISKVQAKLGKDKCKKILVLHALGGSDTTSAVFGHGKGTIFSKLSSSPKLTESIDILQDPCALTDDVKRAGLHLLIAMYGGGDSDTLGRLRHAAYTKMISTSLNRLQPERLPPSENAAYFHSLRVHLQAVTWKTLGQINLDPTLWGWKLDQSQLVPVMTDKPIAPDDILKIIRCQCTSGCNSLRCSCRSNGLKCVSACTNCSSECSNAELQSIHDDDDDFSDDGSLPDVMQDNEMNVLDKELVESSNEVMDDNTQFGNEENSVVMYWDNDIDDDEIVSC